MVDISGLLDEKDGKLDYNWRNAEVDGNKLTISFPNPSYQVVPKQSKVVDEGKTWELYVNKQKQGGVVGMITERTYKIPQGVEKIVIGETDF